MTKVQLADALRPFAKMVAFYDVEIAKHVPPHEYELNPHDPDSATAADAIAARTALAAFDAASGAENELIKDLQKCAQCVYLATAKAPADDIAAHLNRAVDRIQQLVDENGRLKHQVAYLQGESSVVVSYEDAKALLDALDVLCPNLSAAIIAHVTRTISTGNDGSHK